MVIKVSFTQWLKQGWSEVIDDYENEDKDGGDCGGNGGCIDGDNDGDDGEMIQITERKNRNSIETKHWICYPTI